MPLAIQTDIASKPRKTFSASQPAARQQAVASGRRRGLADKSQSDEASPAECDPNYNRLDHFQTQLLNHLSNAVIAIDKDDKIVYWNTHAERLYQWKAGEVLGCSAPEILGQSWKHSTKSKSLVMSLGFLAGEESCYRKDGSKFRGNIIRSPLRDSDGEEVGMVCVTTDISERKRAERQLKQSKQQLRALTAHLQWAREKERTRIAREIHDELGQALSGIKMDLSWLTTHHKQKTAGSQDVSFRERLHRINEMVHSTIREVRRISTELRPRVLDELGLIAALEWQAKDFELRWGIPCCFATNVETVDLDDHRKTAIFRIFQETLTNISKHAGASRVNVLFLQRKQTVTLEVQDNGKGIPAKKISGASSLGLLGMRERAFLAKGILEIHSSARTGTAITASFPLPGSISTRKRNKQN